MMKIFNKKFTYLMTLFISVMTLFAFTASSRVLNKRNTDNKFNEKRASDIMKIKEDDSNKSYNLLIFGDIGQVEYFKNKIYIGKGNNSFLKNEWYEKILLKEQYIIESLQCKVRDSDIKNKKNENNEDNSDFKDLSLEGGLENFSKIFLHSSTKKFIRESDGIIILGDIIYPEIGELVIERRILPYREKWIQRLKCSWNLFLNILHKANLIKINNTNELKDMDSKTKLSNFDESTINLEIDQKVEIIAGNHSFDVDVEEEENFIKSLKPSELSHSNRSFLIQKETFGEKSKGDNVFTYTPKFVRIKSHNFQIEFLDYNPSIIQCLTGISEDDYLKCIYSPSAISYQEALDYAGRLYKAFSKFTKVNKNANLRIWKVVRSHQPPFNSEDSDKATAFFFKKIEANKYDDIKSEDDKIFDVSNEEKEKIQFILFDLLKENKIHIYLASHIHISQVLAFPYSRAYKEILAENICNNYEIKTKEYGCLLRNTNHTEKLTLSKECQNNLKYTLNLDLKTKDFNLNLDNNQIYESDILYIFVNGLGGRDLDGLKYGFNSNALTLWSRAYKDNLGFSFGFSKISFNEYSVIIDFFELENTTNNIITSATFFIKDGKQSNFDNLLKQFDNVCLQETQGSNKLKTFVCLIGIIIVLFGIAFFAFRYFRKMKNEFAFYSKFPKFQDE